MQNLTRAKQPTSVDMRYLIDSVDINYFLDCLTVFKMRH